MGFYFFWFENQSGRGLINATYLQNCCSSDTGYRVLTIKLTCTPVMLQEILVNYLCDFLKLSAMPSHAEDE